MLSRLIRSNKADTPSDAIPTLRSLLLDAIDSATQTPLPLIQEILTLSLSILNSANVGTEALRKTENSSLIFRPAS